MDPRDAATVTLDALKPSTSPSSQIMVMWKDGHATYPLPKSGQLVIGRSLEADIPIDDASVSRKHATLTLDEPIRVEDHGSANGTLIGGARIESNVQVPVPAGAVIQLGAVLVSLIQSSPAAGGAAAASNKKQKTTKHGADRPEADSSAEHDEDEADDGGIVVVDPAMQRVHQLVDIAARSKLSVLLLGETGVGKEVLASRLHSASPRATKSFLKINCAALVESLLEAELFGYERGAFTGAVQAKAGLLESAHEGTLFLDELGELPLATQAKLLRVLESGEVMRVGALKPRTVDVRFVSATNRDLREQIKEGRFREDLFFRLDGVSIKIPPLRERTSEIVPLAMALLKQAATDGGRSAPPRLHESTGARLIGHAWPGNVRELRNVMQRSLLFCTGDVLMPEELHFESMGGNAAPAGAGATATTASDAKSDASPNEAAVVTSATSEDESPLAAKKRRVIETLEKCVWNQTRAAQMLGVSRRTLQTWLKELDIPRPRAGGGTGGSSG